MTQHETTDDRENDHEAAEVIPQLMAYLYKTSSPPPVASGSVHLRWSHRDG